MSALNAVLESFVVTVFPNDNIDGVEFAATVAEETIPKLFNVG